MEQLKTRNRSVFFLGDIAISGDISIDSIPAFSGPLNELTGEDSFIFANLEIPVSNEKFSPIHRCNGVTLESALKAMRVTHLNLANNHILDSGVDGLKATIEILNQLGIQYTGVSLSGQVNPMFMEINGNNIAILGYVHPDTHIKNYPISGVALNVWDEESVKTDVENWQKKGFEIWISIHWGEDYSYYPTSSQKMTAKFLASLKVKMLLGHHAHVPQPCQKVGDLMSFYGLGGYVFGNFRKRNQWNALFKKTKRGLIISCELETIGDCKYSYFQSFERWNHRVTILPWHFDKWSKQKMFWGVVKHSNSRIRKVFSIFEKMTCKFRHATSEFGTTAFCRLIRR